MEDIDPYFSRQLDRNKERVIVSTTSNNIQKVGSSIRNMIEKLYNKNSKSNIVFATNWDERLLNTIGLNSVELNQKYERLIYVLVSPWGPLSKQDQTTNKVPPREGSDLSSFFGASMLSDVLGAGSILSCACPLYWGNMITSIHIKTSIDMALFHLERVGQGQRVDLNLMRSGMYCNLMYTNMAQVNSSMSLQIEKMTFDSYETKDGKWIQMLGVDYLKHVPIIFKCFGVSVKGWFSLLKEIFSSPSVLKDPLKIVPLAFANITRTMRTEIGKRNWSELKTLFDEKKVWYTHIAVSELCYYMFKNMVLYCYQLLILFLETFTPLFSINIISLGT